MTFVRQQSILKTAATGSLWNLKLHHVIPLLKNLLMAPHFCKALQDLPMHLTSASLNSPPTLLPLISSAPAYWAPGSSANTPGGPHFTICPVWSLSWNAPSPNGHMACSLVPQIFAQMSPSQWDPFWFPYALHNLPLLPTPFYLFVSILSSLSDILWNYVFFNVYCLQASSW